MKAIAAMSCNRVIGSNGKLPWKNNRDMRLFRALTFGSKLVMGRKTFDSVGILPHRTTHVVTNNIKLKNIICSKTGKDEVTFGDFKSVDIDGENNSWLCGGAQLYERFLPACTDLYLTIILDDYYGDVVMPSFEGYLSQQRIIKEFKDMWVVHYWDVDTWANEAYREGFDYQLANAISGGCGALECPYSREQWNTGKSVLKEADRNMMRSAWLRGYAHAPEVQW